MTTVAPKRFPSWVQFRVGCSYRRLSVAHAYQPYIISEKVKSWHSMATVTPQVISTAEWNIFLLEYYNSYVYVRANAFTQILTCTNTHTYMHWHPHTQTHDCIVVHTITSLNTTRNSVRESNSQPLDTKLDALTEKAHVYICIIPIQNRRNSYK